MRQYRGKRIDNGEWVYGYGLIFGEHYGVHHGEEREASIFVEYDDVARLNFQLVAVDPKTVGQYTGLKDKNGVEIYERDIIQQEYHAEVGHVYNGTNESFDGYHIGEVVIIASKGACMRNPLCYAEETGETRRINQYKRIAGYRSEVIGNIDENLELIRRK